MKKEIESSLNESINIKVELLSSSVESVIQIANMLIEAFKTGHSLYLMGNGGSAADAQHISGELVGRFKKNRKPLPALALTTDTSVLTAIANDFGYDLCFERQVDAFVKNGDVVFSLSTSGNSVGIINATILAKKKGAKTIAFTGKGGGRLKDHVDLCLEIPSTDTARIQECHITIGHILCSLVEKELFG
ncbi:MAG: D-sedoheptulose 7-phosphate isomerase [Candidatus Scalindua sp.]|nr:D-sedoheptulose 7-phosphate isomerase [Candidatus Scalindua sp.]MBT5305878.1 D-sedoheptulose 7-phosphate isomerase [Candidatus Scalindua sp.]MBT6047390.1 D-sedoheptulose 7-phosphate isomerase [Candidatus Scalindua sp.]MBT6228252.1 D-sedoheptulose 7-phosphate isomerase [Candidatus Scalindua sp.]MBT6563103.1 D-sedoheptulose 7-phosphate isomerase [Candidatus Scalindua sp.]